MRFVLFYRKLCPYEIKRSGMMGEKFYVELSLADFYGRFGKHRL